MAFWPFRLRLFRRRRKVKPSGPADESRSMQISDTDPRRHEPSPNPSAAAKKARRDSQKNRKPSREPTKLQKPRRTYSFSPGRADDIRVVVHANGTSQSPPHHARNQGPSPHDDERVWPRMPTLHHQKDTGRRRLSKQNRHDEQLREAELRAKLEVLPTYRQASAGSARESRSKHGRPSQKGHPSSASRPTSDSLHSLSPSYENSYLVSAFDVLAPRPTLRCSGSQQYLPGASGLTAARSGSRRQRVTRPITQETLKGHRRVDSLADDLDAAELRELMERDQKRRERKMAAERVRMEKRLAKRQEKQAQPEGGAERQHSAPPPNMERGVLGRELPQSSTGPSAVMTSSKRRSSDEWLSSRSKRPTEAFRQDTPTSSSDAQLAETETPLGYRASAKEIGPLTPSISEAAENTPQTTPNKKSWTSFFRRSSKSQRRVTPPSFSNTSRDSMRNAQTPQTAPSPLKQTSNIPKRTMSKFREDLPELPTPPSSRMTSPEADDVPPIAVYAERKLAPNTLEPPSIARYDTPNSGFRSVETMRMRAETPTSGDTILEDASPEPVDLPQSLASIDSEASWLSGKRISKRKSVQMPSYPLRDSADSLSRRYRELQDRSDSVEPGLAEDEYFSRLTPGLEDKRRSTLSSVDPAMSENGLDGETKWGAVARHPTIVHREEPHRVPSRHGMLNDMDSDSDCEESSSPIRKSYVSMDEPSLHRAGSIDYGSDRTKGHASLTVVKPRPSQNENGGD